MILNSLQIYTYGTYETEEKYAIKRPWEAYATILHSVDVYVCGATVAAQSIRMAGSPRDLVILVDETNSQEYRSRIYNLKGKNTV